MKIFLGAKNKPLDRKSAMALAAINLLATPGLGTIMAGRWLAGLSQLAFASAGFLLVMKWFYSLFQSALEGRGFAASTELKFGILLFVIGWLASGWSSVSLVRAASGPNQPTATPPKLDGSAG